MKSHYLYCLLFFLIGFFSTHAQTENRNSKFELGFADVYVLEVSIDSTLLVAKNHCDYKKQMKSILYRVRVESVIYSARNTVFDSAALLNIKYLIVPVSYKSQLDIGKKYFITARPSTSLKQLAMTRLFDNVSIRHSSFYHKYAYQSGLINCPKRSKFDEYLSQQ